MAALSICLLAAGPGRAGTQRSAPEGLQAGPWALSPYFETQWESDENVFRTDCGGFSVGRISDEINSVTAGIDAVLPFRNSDFELSYEASQERYKSTTFSLDTDESLSAGLILNINNKDAISIRDSYYRGNSDIGRIENSEVVFDGEAFRQNRIDLEMFRGVNREKGYYFRLTQVDHEFTEREAGEGSASFFNYTGLDGGVEYRQPLASYKWIVGYYGFRRFDHSFDGNEVDRRERSETAQIGIRGLAGKDKPVLLRIGWSRFRYEFLDGRPETETSTLAYRLDWDFQIGGGSDLGLALSRQTLPSSSDTYFDSTEFSAEFGRDILRESSFNLDLRVGRNDYGDATSDCDSSLGTVRQDYNYRVRGGLDLRPHERFAYQIDASYQIRESNCVYNIGPERIPDKFDYHAFQIGIGVSFGWF